MLRCYLNKSWTSTRMQMLTASLLRRSCSLFRAISLSFSIGVCVIKGSVVDLGSSTSSRVSNAASAPMFSFRSASFLTGSRFSTVLHGSRQLKGKDVLISGNQTFIDKKVYSFTNRFAKYLVFPGDTLLSFPSTCFFSAFTRSFSKAALRKCWKASFDDFPEARVTE